MNASLRHLLAAIALLTASSAGAEGYLYSPYAHRPVLLTAGWELAVPMTNLRSDFINATSATGLAVGVRYELATQLSAGLEVAWNRFEQASPLGDMFRMETVTGRARIDYYLTGSEIQPYVGLGVGGVYREAVLNGGPTQTGPGLCGGPELGVLLTFSQGLALNVAARYEITSASFDVNGNPNWHVSLPSWVAVQVGLAVY